MAIVVLVLWLFTAGAGFYLLVTSNLGRARAAPNPAPAAPAQAVATAPASKRELRRAARDRFDPPSLTAAKNAPVVPGLRSLLEFAHPASALVGLGFWLAYTFVHYRALGWIGFGLVTATVCLGLTWFTANARAARTQGSPGDEPPASFSTRLVVLHGGAAAVTFSLAALTVLVLGR
jgi:hypothetical protein